MCSVLSSGTNGSTCVKQQFIFGINQPCREISVISKRGYFTVNRRTGIMIDLGVEVFIQTVWFAQLSLKVALVIRYFCVFWDIFSNLRWLSCCCPIPIVQTINDTTKNIHLHPVPRQHPQFEHSQLYAMYHLFQFGTGVAHQQNWRGGVDLELWWRLSVFSQMLLCCSYICPKRRVLLVVEMAGILVWLQMNLYKTNL